MQNSEEKLNRDTRRAKSQVMKKKVLTSPLLGKSHGHVVKRTAPEICPDCRGRCYSDMNIECFTCGGEGEI